MNVLKCASVSLLGLMFHCCGSGTSGNTLEGRVTLDGYEGRPVYLETVSSDPQRVDSAVVEDGKFFLTLEDTVPQVYCLALSASDNDPYAIRLPVVSEKGHIRVSMGELVLTSGTPLNDALQDFLLAVSTFTDKVMEQDEPDMQRIRDGFAALVEDAVMLNITSPVGAYIYRMYGDRLSPEKRETILKHGSDSFRKALDN